MEKAVRTLQLVTAGVLTTIVLHNAIVNIVKVLPYNWEAIKSNRKYKKEIKEGLNTGTIIEKDGKLYRVNPGRS